VVLWRCVNGASTASAAPLCKHACRPPTPAAARCAAAAAARFVIAQDEGFKKWVNIYAASKKDFFADFARAMQKLQELGTTGLYTV
jgi:hypothetical protein